MKSKEEGICHKCGTLAKDLFTMGGYMETFTEFVDGQWFCKSCFNKKLKKLNRERKRAGKQVLEHYES